MSLDRTSTFVIPADPAFLALLKLYIGSNGPNAIETVLIVFGYKKEPNHENLRKASVQHVMNVMNLWRDDPERPHYGIQNIDRSISMLTLRYHPRWLELSDA